MKVSLTFPLGYMKVKVRTMEERRSNWDKYRDWYFNEVYSPYDSMWEELEVAREQYLDWMLEAPIEDPMRDLRINLIESARDAVEKSRHKGSVHSSLGRYQQWRYEGLQDGTYPN
jgi:hypothetical protein